MALGAALQKTGVVSFVSVSLMSAAAPLGSMGVIAMVYIIAVVLSMFINNSATIAILSPVVVSMSNADENLDLELMVWTLVLSAGSCFTTPLGYQTNLMVMSDGKYSFSDFARFGGLIQLVHGAAVVTIIG